MVRKRSLATSPATTTRPTVFGALYGNTTGYNNAANGYYALLYNTIGNNNTANGVQALQSNTTGSNNTANGVQALQNNTGANNTGLGYNAGSTLTTGNGTA